MAKEGSERQQYPTLLHPVGAGRYVIIIIIRAGPGSLHRNAAVQRPNVVAVLARVWPATRRGEPEKRHQRTDRDRQPGISANFCH